MVPERKETNEVNLPTVLACCLERIPSHITGRGKPRWRWSPRAELTGLGLRGGQADWTSQGRHQRAELHGGGVRDLRIRTARWLLQLNANRHTHEESGRGQETAPRSSQRLSITLRNSSHPQGTRQSTRRVLSRSHKISPRLKPALAPPNKA